MILPAETILKAASTPLNRTVVAESNFAPLIVTKSPSGPEVGEKLEMTGDVTVNEAMLDAVPAGVVTLMRPVVAVAGTIAVIRVSETNVKAAGLALNFTVVAPDKLTPVKVTSVPAGPLMGEKLVMRGATTKLAALCVAPAALATRIGPVRAFLGTEVVI